MTSRVFHYTFRVNRRIVKETIKDRLSVRDEFFFPFLCGLRILKRIVAAKNKVSSPVQKNMIFI